MTNNVNGRCQRATPTDQARPMFQGLHRVPGVAAGRNLRTGGTCTPVAEMVAAGVDAEPALQPQPLG